MEDTWQAKAMVSEMDTGNIMQAMVNIVRPQYGENGREHGSGPSNH